MKNTDKKRRGNRRDEGQRTNSPVASTRRGKKGTANQTGVSPADSGKKRRGKRRFEDQSQLSPVASKPTADSGKLIAELVKEARDPSARGTRSSGTQSDGSSNHLDPTPDAGGTHSSGTSPNCDPATGSGGGGRSAIVSTNEKDPSPDPIAALRELQCQRVILMRSSQRLTNQAKAFVRRMLGWHGGLSEKESTKIAARASAIVAAIESGEATANASSNRLRDPSDATQSDAAIFIEDIKGDSDPSDDTGIEAEDCPVHIENRDPIAACRMLVDRLHHSRQIIDATVKQIDADMCSLALHLPAAEFVNSKRGLGLKGLAIIVGEAGDIGQYSIRGLRKFMGLAPMFGKACSTWRRSIAGQEKLTAEQWTQAGYCPRRMSIMYQLSESAGVKCKGDYRDIYDRARSREESRTDVKMIQHRRAMRKVASQILIDLQLAWSKYTGKPLPVRRHREAA